MYTYLKSNWASEASLHTSESQLRSDMYIYVYIIKSSKVNACMFNHQKFKGQCVSIPSGYVQTSILARAGLHVRAFFAHIPH